MRDDVYVGMLVSRDSLKHYGVGHLNGGHSGRYPWGSGKRPKQSNEKKDSVINDIKDQVGGIAEGFKMLKTAADAIKTEVGDYFKYAFKSDDYWNDEIRKDFKRHKKTIENEKARWQKQLAEVGVDTSNPYHDVIKKGSILTRFSGSPKETLDKRKYASILLRDQKIYEQDFGPYKYELRAKKDIILPKSSYVVETLLKQKWMNKGIEEYHNFLKEIDYLNASTRVSNLSKSKKRHDWMMAVHLKEMGDQLGWATDNALMGKNTSIPFLKSDKTYKHFENLGFDAVPDTNDQYNTYGPRYPIIILKPSDSIEVVKIDEMEYEE